MLLLSPYISVFTGQGIRMHFPGSLPFVALCRHLCRRHPLRLPVEGGLALLASILGRGWVIAESPVTAQSFMVCVLPCCC